MENLIQKLLAKPRWTLTDIESYFSVRKTKASEISQKAKKLHPRETYGAPRRDDVLSVMGVDLERELAILRLISFKELEERIKKLEEKENVEKLKNWKL